MSGKTIQTKSGRLFCIHYHADEKNMVNSFYEYLIPQQAFEPKASLNEQRSQITAVHESMRDLIYVVGGLDFYDESFGSCEYYDIKHNKWEVM